jgi:hypothetical protein
MRVRAVFIGMIFAAAIVASLATSLEPAWHVSDSVKGIRFMLSPTAPEAAFTFAIIGNRATFPDSAALDPMWREREGHLQIEAELQAPETADRSRPARVELEVAGPESDIVPKHQRTTTELAAGTQARASLEGTWNAEVDCAADDCQRDLILTVSLREGGPVSGTLDVTAALDGPQVPAHETPKGAKLRVRVESATKR